MAIIFTTGTINQPDAGSVGLAMAEKIRDDVVAHVAWDLVEEFTPAGGAVRWYVLKCLATQSGLPVDFFVVMGRTLGSGELRFGICEEYTAVSHLMAKMGILGSSGVLLYDSEGRAPSTYTLSTIAFPSTSNSVKAVSWIPSGTSTKWWITVAEDGFTVAFNGASNSFVHIGAYIPLTALPLTMPIQITGLSDAQGAITRNPSVAAGSAAGYALTIDRAALNLGFAADLRYNDKLQSNQRPVAERAITIQQATGPISTIDYGWALGKQKRMRVGGAVPAGFAFGDAYALSGRLWVPYLPTDGQIWDTGVASS